MQRVKLGDSSASWLTDNRGIDSGTERTRDEVRKRRKERKKKETTNKQHEKKEGNRWEVTVITHPDIVFLHIFFFFLPWYTLVVISSVVGLHYQTHVTIITVSAHGESQFVLPSWMPCTGHVPICHGGN